MERTYPTLLSPIQIGNLTMKNRMFSAPMGAAGITADGHYTPEASAYYELRAKGGAAVVTCSEGIVHPTGRSHRRMIDLQDEFVLRGLTETARAIKKHGAFASIEISHSGKFFDTDPHEKGVAQEIVRYGPSADTLPSGAAVQEMPKSLIAEIVEQFGKGAALCKRAGFDMVLLHAGHGWLIHQFLNTADNRRGDEYGGSLPNRTRLLFEVLDSIRGAVGHSFPIEIRMSAEDYLPGGNSFADTIEVAKLIQDRVDLIQVSTGSYIDSFDRTHPSMFAPRGANVHYAAAVKEQVKTPVATLGAIDDPAMMEEILTSGKADIIEMGRALLADPYLPTKVMTGREDEITHCIRCFTCHSERIQTQTRICSVNPVIGREIENRNAFPPTTPKKVLIAGGGPAGMKCAVTAARRGHDVTLYEKDSALGGALRSERKVEFKHDFFDLARVLGLEMERAGVKVVMNTALTPEIAAAEQPDVVVVAVGATAILPPLPGADHPKVISANRLSDDDVTIGDTVVIMGGGLVGCEAAAHLAMEGRDVTIVEMLDAVARDVNTLQGAILKKTLAGYGVKILLDTKGTEITDAGLAVEGADGSTQVLAADTILMAVGQRPLTDVADSLRDAAPLVLPIGDCVQPGKVTEALVVGYYTGLDI
ncbi:MAG: FAD-dependent oxidoreductase [Clostridiales Family XIII bacterium]|jgi:2,4-dienoyl-CoA reductase-like NADH-dependent reductase (Old Yellow Enzyme family)/thioredoxin reductase|nr:FAD-dependent oxidoreductase [Clostridiales Family XIII bacterium]